MLYSRSLLVIHFIYMVCICQSQSSNLCLPREMLNKEPRQARKILKANNSDCETMALGLVITDLIPFTALFKAGKRKWGIIENEVDETGAYYTE